MTLRRATLLVTTALLAATPAAAAVARPTPAMTPTATTSATAPVTANHFITNLHGAVAAPKRIGYTVFDSGSSSAQVAALPSGVRAMVWLGQKCPTKADAAFRSTVTRLATSRKVFAYYLSDEPHIADCPGGPAALASRANFVRQATGGRQKSFVVLSKVADFKPFRPGVTHVSMIGLDPYPCSTANPTCDVDKIDQRVAAATAAGIPLGRVVPTYQAFGQGATSSHYYNLPTVTQMRAMVARWAKVVPTPPMDYTYGWGHQSSANPTLVDSPGLQSLFTSYFSG